jgi:hypothetical protein
MGWVFIGWIRLTLDRDKWRATVNMVISVSFKVFTVVTLKNAVLWDIKA